MVVGRFFSARFAADLLTKRNSNQGTSLDNFNQIDLIKPLRQALVEEGYETPTPIQARTIPSAIDGRDVLGCAQTGTGKTAAFALPILNYLGETNRRSTPNCPRALVLAPTRELAIQIGDSFKTYGRHLKLRTVLVFGGVKQGNQTRELDRGVHVLVATPGRLLDLMEQQFIDLQDLEIFVLDEADRMMDMGFLPDLKRVIRELPEERQSLFFSATMPPKIVELSKSLLYDPISVNVTPKKTSVELIEQQVMHVDRKEKIATLVDILSDDDVDQAIVFTRTKRGANMVVQRLERNRIGAVAIHGNKSQNARQRALKAFRENQIQVLVATDVAARGIDIEGVTHVVNYDMPVDPESYVHRIGRTGRAGAEGIAISLCTDDERAELRDIERLIKMRVPLAPGHEEPTGPIIKKKPQQRGGGGRNGGRGRNGGGRGGSGRGGQRRGGPSSRGRAESSGDGGGSEKPKRQRRRKPKPATANSGGRSGARAGSSSEAGKPKNSRSRSQRPGKNARRRSSEQS